MRRALSLCAATALTAVLCCPQAWAISPPTVDPGATPPTGTPGPGQPMQRVGPCTTSGVIPGSDPAAGTTSQAGMNLPAAWQFSRGEGQLVAVLDTGVRPGPRLPNVGPGGDFVETTDGLTDCDGHGTLVAGIIAGQPGADAFTGVAPAARLVSIRVTSAMFSPRPPGGDPQVGRASSDAATLARAIVHAADLGARVIDVSVATCLPADRAVDQAGLGAAIRYAAVDRNAVVVAAAGNRGAASCESNPLTDPARPADPRNWAAVTSVSIPSWWQPYVLSTASLAPDGQPSTFTVAGPWVGIAAPGENIVSLSNGDGGGLANGLPSGLPGDQQRMTALHDTGYAAGYVAGVAALVRARYPDLTAPQVVQRITATAHGGARAPSNLVGAGSIDAVAALTWQLPDGNPQGVGTSAKPVAVPAVPAPESATPRTVAFAGTAALALAVGAVAAAVTIARRKQATR